MNLKLKNQNFIIILSILIIILFNFITNFYYNSLIKNNINTVININSEIIEKTTNIEKNFYQQSNIIFQNLLITDQDELNNSYEFLNVLIKENHLLIKSLSLYDFNSDIFIKTQNNIHNFLKKVSTSKKEIHLI